MYCIRMYIKSFESLQRNRIAKVDFSLIKAELKEKGIFINTYKSCVSEEIIKIPKFGKIYFHLTKIKPNGILFIYEKIYFQEEIKTIENEFFILVETHFRKWFSFFFKKEMKKILSVKRIFST